MWVLNDDNVDTHVRLTPTPPLYPDIRRNLQVETVQYRPRPR